MRFFLVLVLAGGFVGTTGFLFREHFQKNPVLFILVACLALVSTLFTIEEIGKRLGVFAPQPPPVSLPATEKATSPDVLFWFAIKDTTTISVLEHFLATYPNSAFADAARARLADLKKTGAPAGISTSPAAAPTSPVATSTSVSQSFDGIRILYFRKEADQGIVENVLRKNAILFEMTPGQNEEKTNIVTCALDLPFERAKQLALMLVDAGVELKAIHQHSHPAPRRLTIEARQSLHDARVLGRNDILQMTECSHPFRAPEYRDFESIVRQ